MSDLHNIAGYAAVWNKPTLHRKVYKKKHLWLYEKTGRDVKMYLEHDASAEIGFWEKCIADNYGLWIEGQIDLLLIGKQVMNCRGLSICVTSYFGGRVHSLTEISLVRHPAQPAANYTISLRHE